MTEKIKSLAEADKEVDQLKELNCQMEDQLNAQHEELSELKKINDQSQIEFTIVRQELG